MKCNQFLYVTSFSKSVYHRSQFLQVANYLHDNQSTHHCPFGEPHRLKTPNSKRIDCLLRQQNTFRLVEYGLKFGLQELSYCYTRQSLRRNSSEGKNNRLLLL